MIYQINEWWLICLIITPFVLGLLSGIRVAKQKITMKLLKTLSIDEFKKLMDSE